MIVGMFTTSYRLFFCLGGIYTLFLKWTPSTNANIFSRYCAHFGKTLNVSTANYSASRREKYKGRGGEERGGEEGERDGKIWEKEVEGGNGRREMEGGRDRDRYGEREGG